MISEEWRRLFSASLHPLETPDDQLPVIGYSPVPKNWAPQSAAVLVPILDKPEPCLLLTVRHRALTKHAGQVALPGGRREDDEPFPLATALREAAEEIGLAETLVRPLGLLDRVDTISRFRVTPVVALIAADARPVACPREVSHVFELPLAWALDLSRHREHLVRRYQQEFKVRSVAAQQWPIWGATATILHQLALRALGPSAD